MNAGMRTLPAVIPMPMTAVPKNSPQVPRTERQITPVRIISSPMTMMFPALRRLPRSPMTIENAANISSGIVVTVPMVPDDTPRSDCMTSARGPTQVNGARRQNAAKTIASARLAIPTDRFKITPSCVTGLRRGRLPRQEAHSSFLPMDSFWALRSAILASHSLILS